MPRKDKIKIVLDNDADADSASYYYAGETVRGCVLLRFRDNIDNDNNSSSALDSDNSSRSPGRKVLISLIARAGVEFAIQSQHYEEEQTLLQHTIVVKPTRHDADERIYQADFELKLPISIPGSVDLSHFGNTDPLSAIAYQLQASLFATGQPATCTAARLLEIMPNRPAPMPILLQPHTRAVREQVHQKRRFWHFFSRQNKAAGNIQLKLSLPRRAFAVTEWMDTVGSYAINNTRTHLRVELSLLCYKQMTGVAVNENDNKSSNNRTQTKLAIQESKLLTASLQPRQRLDIAGCHEIPDKVVPSWRHDDACLRWTYALQLMVVTASAKKKQQQQQRSGNKNNNAVVAKVRIPVLLCAAPPILPPEAAPKPSKYPKTLQTNDPWSVFKYASFRRKACPTMKNMTSFTTSSGANNDDVDDVADNSGHSDESSASSSSSSSSCCSSSSSSSDHDDTPSSGYGGDDEENNEMSPPDVVLENVPGDDEDDDDNVLEEEGEKALVYEEGEELEVKEKIALEEAEADSLLEHDDNEDLFDAEEESNEETNIDEDSRGCSKRSNSNDGETNQDMTEDEELEKVCVLDFDETNDDNNSEIDQAHSGEDDLQSIEDDEESVWLDTNDDAPLQEGGEQQLEGDSKKNKDGTLQLSSYESSEEFEIEETSISSHDPSKDSHSEPLTESLSSLELSNESVDISDPGEQEEKPDKSGIVETDKETDSAGSKEQIHKDDWTQKEPDSPSPLLVGPDESSNDDDLVLGHETSVDDVTFAAVRATKKQLVGQKEKKTKKKNKEKKSGSHSSVDEEGVNETKAKKKKGKKGGSYSDLDQEGVKGKKAKKKKGEKSGSKNSDLDQEDVKETKANKKKDKKSSSHSDFDEEDVKDSKAKKEEKKSVSYSEVDEEDVKDTKAKKKKKKKSDSYSDFDEENVEKKNENATGTASSKSDSDSDEEEVSMQVTKRKTPAKTISANLEPTHHVSIEDRYLAAVDCFRRKPSKPPSDEDIYKLNSIVQAVTFQKGETIIDNEQEQEACIFFIRRGKAETLQQGRYALMFLPGTQIGDDLFLDAKRKRKTTGKARDKVTAETKVVCGVVRIRDYFEIYGDEYEDTARNLGADGA